MKGSIQQRSKRSWRLRYDAPLDSTGKRKQITETVRGTRKEAERVLRERLTVIENGGFVPKADETVAEFIVRWLNDYASMNTTPSTQRGYRSKIRQYIIPSLGNIKPQSLTPRHVQSMYSDIVDDRGLSARTTLHAHRVLRQALNHAVRWGLLVRNPAGGATPPRPEGKEVKMWDGETINAFLKVAEDSQFRDIYHLAILTGMPRSEMLGLQWENVDFDAAVVRVVKTLQRINGYGLYEGKPKTQKSRRSIALSPVAVALLRKVRTNQLERRIAAGPAWSDSDYVFCQADGKPLHPDKVSNDFRRIVKREGLPYLTLHGLRHAHATLMLKRGIHPKIVSERLGHANISVTMDIYSHLLPGMQEAAALAVDEALAPG